MAQVFTVPKNSPKIPPVQTLKKCLIDIDSKGYKAYKSIEGCYQFDQYRLSIDHVQGDPFATPSRLSLQIPQSIANFPQHLWQNQQRRIALEDYLARRVERMIRGIAKGRRGSGCSGEITISTSGQQVLQRNAILVHKDYIEARITAGLPANGRRIAAQHAMAMLFDELPAIVIRSLHHSNLDADEITKHVQSIEDQEFLRRWLDTEGLVAFVANGSILPRLSGVLDQPLCKNALPFHAPKSLTHGLELPNTGAIQGMGIPPGVTLIVGGGFHGKSTLLHALERGPYNHIPGDGRERVVTHACAVKIRAEDGRSISKVNISPFIDKLPFGRDTVAFTTDNASGSTSQAANIIEALACGSKILLIDEDTSATNFMIRDERMQALVSQDKEPITPLVYRVRELYDKHGISSIIVMGGSGDYFEVADTVIMMNTYQPFDVTEQAHRLATENPCKPIDSHQEQPSFNDNTPRKPDRVALDPSRRNRDIKIDTKAIDLILYGEHRIDLAQVEQLIDIGQTRCIGLMILYYAQHYADTDVSLIEGLQKLFNDTETSGLDILSLYKTGNLAMPRLYELAAAINRIREGQWM